MWCLQWVLWESESLGFGLNLVWQTMKIFKSFLAGRGLWESCPLCAWSERGFKSSREITLKEDVRKDMTYLIS